MDINLFYDRLDQLYAGEDAQNVERFLLDCIEESKKDAAFLRLLIAAYNELGSYYRGVSKLTQSAEAFLNARKLIIDFFGGRSIEHATLLNNLGGTYRLMKKSEEALQTFLEALAIYDDHDMSNQYMYAAASNNVALLYQDNNEYDKAEEFLFKALGIIKEIPAYAQEVAITYSNIAILYLLKGDHEKSKEFLEQSRTLFDTLGEDQKVHYAAAINNIASYHFQQGNYDKAAESYVQAGELTQKHFGRNLEYAAACKNAAIAFEKLGDINQALILTQKACDALLSLLPSAHEDIGYAQKEIARLEALLETRQ